MRIIRGYSGIVPPLCCLTLCRYCVEPDRDARCYGAATPKPASQAPRKGWCRRRDLNPRPPAYEADALPLSYTG